MSSQQFEIVAMGNGRFGYQLASGLAAGSGFPSLYAATAAAHKALDAAKVDRSRPVIQDAAALFRDYLHAEFEVARLEAYKSPSREMREDKYKWMGFKTATRAQLTALLSEVSA